MDLHLHTINSDGDNTPDEVIRLAAQEGLQVIALTDHNKLSLRIVNSRNVSE
ncbi:PHP domain-containing protein [Bariatricus sp. HCP28S3_D3]|uniref:PHP domain-containing protein n=1 Tax=Bariatricus sp. HCP28S3_D3 TaxID=3438901 RepID=UPI003F8BDA76